MFNFVKRKKKKIKKTENKSEQKKNNTEQKTTLNVENISQNTSSDAKPEYEVSKVVLDGKDVIDNPQKGISLANRGKNIWMDITIKKKS